MGISYNLPQTTAGTSCLGQIDSFDSLVWSTKDCRWVVVDGAIRTGKSYLVDNLARRIGSSTYSTLAGIAGTRDGRKVWDWEGHGLELYDLWFAVADLQLQLPYLKIVADRGYTSALTYQEHTKYLELFKECLGRLQGIVILNTIPPEVMSQRFKLIAHSTSVDEDAWRQVITMQTDQFRQALQKYQIPYFEYTS